MVLQGLVVLVVGISMVFSFLLLLVLLMTIAGKIIPRFNHVLPDAQPKVKNRKHASATGSSSVQEASAVVAVAIAAAFAQKQRQ